MQRPAAVLAAALVALALCRMGLTQPVSPVSLQMGISSADPALYSSARAEGARTVRILADWSTIEPERGRPMWADLDRSVSAAIREGLAPLLVLSYTPRWASIGTGADLSRPDVYSRQPPRDVRDWERFAAGAAARYRGRVAEWQVWTQLGLPHFRGTGSEYVRLLQAARSGLRAIDPSARVAIATPQGMDVAFVLRIAQEVPGAFDAAALAPLGFPPESLLRPLGLLSQRLRGSGKTVWLEWEPGESGPADRAAAAWIRMLTVSLATGVERIFALARPASPVAGLRPAALVLPRPFGGYLARGPEVYAVVLGSGNDAILVAWATAQDRQIELAGGPPRQVATPDGRPVPTEPYDGGVRLSLGSTPVIVAGISDALVAEARATAASRGPLLPAVSPDRDYGRSPEVSARLGRVGEERGLYNSPFRSRANGAVEAVEIDGAEAVQTSVARQVVYVYFDIDDTFLYLAEGRVPLEITVEVHGAQASRQAGFNLLYDATSGYRFTPWQWVDVREGWVRYTARLTDANMANTWGWDFAINTAGNRAEDLIVRSVTVRKGTP